MNTILVVEDDEATRYANVRILREAGFEVWEAGTGVEALRRAQEQPDLILLDIQLPDITGLEVCKRLKRNPAMSSTPVLHLTATYGAAQEQAAALEGGADGYLTHPVEPIVLVATIRALLRTRTAEMQARRLTSWWQSTFDAIGHGVGIVGRDGRYLRCNKALADLTGTTPDAMIGVPANPFLPGAVAPPEGWAVDRVFATGKRAWAEIGIGERWYEVVADPVLYDEGKVSAVVRTLKDITARKAADGRMAELLQREQSAREEAERVNRLKDEFLATLSHELRTPLNAIVGWIHLLRQGGLDEEQTAQAVETIARNAHQQSQLISDILDVSRIIAGKLRVERRPMDLVRVVHDAWETIKPAAEAKGISYETVFDPAAGPFNGDPDRLQQVVWNLLSNAVKFTPRGGRIEVFLGGEPSSVRLRVEDSGAGIDPAFLPYVFDRFRQEDSSSTRRHAGLGLGLAIVRHLVELHGGTVSARNRSTGSGAIFEIHLPQSILTAPPVAPARATAWQPVEALDAEPPTSLDGTHVLLVDDDEDARALMGFMLERVGATVITASSALEGLTSLRRLRPHVLLADVEMPGTDGYALIASVRALPAEEGGKTPAAAITAYARPVDRERALRAGFQLHLSKPVRPADLVAAVASLKAGEGAQTA